MKKNSIGIPCHNTTHLFWKKFPYKVETRSAVNKKNDYRFPHEYHSNKDIEAATRRYQAALKNLLGKYAQYLPQDKKSWKLFQTYSSFHYYFLNKEDMECFISGNSKNVISVYQPLRDNDINILMSETDIYIRNTLFYNQYRYCMHFKCMDSKKIDELDEWVVNFFGEDEERYFYNNCGIRKLYLKNKDDIFLTRIAFSQYILKVQKVILRSENGSNVSA